MFIKTILQTIPETPAAIYWTIITVLSAAVGSLFWHLMKVQSDYNKSLLDITSKAVEAILAVNQNISSLENALKLVEKIDALTTDRHKR